MLTINLTCMALGRSQCTWGGSTNHATVFLSQWQWRGLYSLTVLENPPVHIFKALLFQHTQFEWYLINSSNKEPFIWIRCFVAENMHLKHTGHNVFPQRQRLWIQDFGDAEWKDERYDVSGPDSSPGESLCTSTPPPFLLLPFSRNASFSPWTSLE